MRSLIQYLILFVILISLCAGCSTIPEDELSDTDAAEYLTPLDQAGLGMQLDTYPIGVLTPAEADDILYIQEEEKLARDVYTALYEKWKNPVFANIGDAEQTHVESLTLLVSRYNLDSSMTDSEGVFSNATLQEMYTQLVSEGSASPTSALNVGAYIEEVDLVDLREAIGRTEKPDIITVYENLARGSRNHLRAFVKVLAQQGEIYEPKVLSPVEYSQILDSPVESGPN